MCWFHPTSPLLAGSRTHFTRTPRYPCLFFRASSHLARYQLPVLGPPLADFVLRATRSPWPLHDDFIGTRLYPFLLHALTWLGPCVDFHFPYPVTGCFACLRLLFGMKSWTTSWLPFPATPPRLRLFRSWPILEQLTVWTESVPGGAARFVLLGRTLRSAELKTGPRPTH